MTSLALVALAPQIAAFAPGVLSSASTPLLRLPEFVIGMTLALMLKRGEWMPPRLGLALPLAVAGYALSEAPTIPGTDVHPGLAATVGFYALLVAALADVDARGRSTFLARPLWQELGRVSFAFYLVHLLVIAAVSSGWPDGHPELPGRQALPLALAAFAIALAIAWILHKLVEVPRSDGCCASTPTRARAVAPSGRMPRPRAPEICSVAAATDWTDARPRSRTRA